MNIPAEVAKRMEIVRTVFPEASLGTDNEGQIIIYTNVYEGDAIDYALMSMEDFEVVRY